MPWPDFWKRGPRAVLPYYYLWQIGAYFLGRRLHREVDFDIVHHATFGQYWVPSFLSFLPVPFIWGPVGGGESAPRSFWKSFSVYGKTYELARDFARWAGEMDPFVRSTARRASLALASTLDSERRLRSLGCKQTRVYPVSALSAQDLMHLRNFPIRAEQELFRVLSVGRLLHWKGFELSLRAFARFHQTLPQSEYWIIGDGPERKRLEKLAHQLGVAEDITFWGALSRPEVLNKLVACDALLHPTLHDSGGFVPLEAMGAGRPVICLDIGGSALEVTDRVGFRVPAHSPNQVVTDIAEKLSFLSEHPEYRRDVAQQARDHVACNFQWTRNGDEMLGIYQKALSEGLSKAATTGPVRAGTAEL